MKQKNWQDAKNDCDKAIECNPEYTKAFSRRVNLGFTWRGMCGSCLTVMCLRLRVVQALCELELEMFQEAVRTYEKVTEMEPSNQEHKRNLKHAKLELKKSKRVDYYKVNRLWRGYFKGR